MNDVLHDWRWANAEGVIAPIDGPELTDLLARGEIAPHALVWRSGWAEWLPAARVGELASALPETKRKPPIEPRRDARRLHPPPLPPGMVMPKAVGNLSKPPPKPPSRPAAKTPSSAPPRAANSPALRRIPLPDTRANTLPGIAPDTPDSSLPDARSPLPTLVDEPGTTATSTLRPPGAVPPPPRGVPPSPRRLEYAQLAKPSALETPIPESIGHVARNREALTSIKSAIASQLARDSDEMPGTPNAPDSSDAVTQREALRAFRNRPTEPPTRMRHWGAPDLLRGPRPRSGRQSARQRYTLAVFGLGTLAGVVATSAVMLIIGQRAPTAKHVRQESKAAAQDANLFAATPHPEYAAASAAIEHPRAEASACSTVGMPQRLASAVLASVPLRVAETPNSGRVLLGYAEGPTAARGVLVDLPSLHVTPALNRASVRPLTAVVPLTFAPRPAFALDLESDGALHFARTVDAKVPFQIGLVQAGIARKAQGRVELVWSDVATNPVSDIRVVTLASGDRAVAYRNGDQSGRIRFGWLGADGRRASDLVDVSPSFGFCGTPTLAENGEHVALAYAFKADKPGFFAIQLALAARKSLPKNPVMFAIPAGGPGSEAISPVLTGLPGARWLLQWTEGSSGSRQVRAQMLDSDLAPQGPPVSLSSPEQNAGQGALVAHDGTVLSLFLVSRSGGHELWGASLECR